MRVALYGQARTLAALLAVFACHTQAADDAPDALTGSFSGWIEVDAKGRAGEFAADGSAEPSFVAAIADQLKQIEFVPAKVDGISSAARTYAGGSYTLEEDGQDLVLTFATVSPGPKIDRLVMPRPPARMLQEVLLGVSGRVSFEINSPGRPVDLTVEVPSESGEFTREMRQSVAKLRFVHESLSLGMQGARFRQEFVFAHDGADPPALPKCPEDTSGRIKTIGQSSCLPLIELRLSKRHGREIHVDNPGR